MTGSQPNKRSIAVWAAVAASTAFWITTMVLLPIVIRMRPGHRGTLAITEGWFCGAAVATSVLGGALYVTGLRTRFFEQGYLAALLDSRGPKVVSITSHPRHHFSLAVDRQDSNKVS